MPRIKLHNGLTQAKSPMVDMKMQKERRVGRIERSAQIYFQEEKKMMKEAKKQENTQATTKATATKVSTGKTATEKLTGQATMKIVMIPLAKIAPNPLNPRKNIGDVSELTASMKKVGILQNLTVIKDSKKPGFYVNLIGHKRAVAAKAAGFKEVPCDVRESMPDKEQVEIMCIENIQRGDLTPLEQADAFQLMLDLGSTEAEIASKTGFSKTTIRNRIKIAKAKIDPEKIKAKEEEGNFQMTLADLGALAEIESAETRDSILKGAKNSAEIQWQCEQAKKEAKAEKQEERLKKLIAALGIEDAPHKAIEDRYTSQQWPKKKCFDCSSEEIPEKLTLADLGCDENGKIDGQKAFFMYDYKHKWSIVTRPVSSAKKVLTKAEQDRKDLMKTDKLIRAKTEDIALKRKDFILALIEHKIPKVKETPELMRMLWDEALLSYDGVNREMLSIYLYDKQYMILSQEEKKEFAEKMEKLSISEQILISLANSVRLTSTVFYGRPCEFNEDSARRIRRVDEILKGFGFTYDDEGILDGTYKEYVKAKEDEKSAAPTDTSAAGSEETSNGEAKTETPRPEVNEAATGTGEKKEEKPEEKPEVLHGEVEKAS